MPWITASEIVGVSLTSPAARRLLDGLAEGKLGRLDDPEVVALGRKLKVMLQVATATENRKASSPRR